MASEQSGSREALQMALLRTAWCTSAGKLVAVFFFFFFLFFCFLSTSLLGSRLYDHRPCPYCFSTQYSIQENTECVNEFIILNVFLIIIFYKNIEGL
jgi:hypothetical protein